MTGTLTNNFSPLQQHKWKLSIQRAKNFEYFCKKVSFPGVQLPAANQPTPFKNIPQYGDKLDYDVLSVVFMLDEDIEGYTEIYQWIRGLGKPSKYSEFKTLKDRDKDYSDNGLKSEITLVMFKNSGNPNKVITFSDCFPISLSGWDLDIEVTNTNVVYAQATFAFTDYVIENV